MRLLSLVSLVAVTLAAPAASQPAPVMPTEASIPLEAGKGRAVALDLADQLEANFVFPETARRYAAALRAKAQSGGYDKAASREALAEMMTADVQAVARDGHLRVFASPPDFSRPAGQQRSAPPPVVEKARWIAPGIAFVRFNGFPGSPESVAATQQFVRDYADAKTLIIDIRTHGGGRLGEMDALFPALFAQPTRLVTMETRAAAEEPLGDLPTLKQVASSPEVSQREHWALPARPASPLAASKVYLLTSGGSASAAEHFALSLKRTHRATLIGEATAGAGHYGDIRPLAHGFAVFLPVGRTFDPDTNQGWEGIGVAPDIAVPAKQALVEALKRVGIAPAEAERLSAELEPQWPVRRPRASAH